MPPKDKAPNTSNTPKRPAKTKESFMFPSLHDSVRTAISSYPIPKPAFYPADTDAGATKTWLTNVLAQFRCHRKGCGNTWTSGIVSALIRAYPGDRYNAVVFNQRCRRCKSLGTMKLDEECYIERIATRLKAWGGIRTEFEARNNKKTPPHESDLCEGCKRGYCQRATRRAGTCGRKPNQTFHQEGLPPPVSSLPPQIPSDPTHQPSREPQKHRHEKRSSPPAGLEPRPWQAMKAKPARPSASRRLPPRQPGADQPRRDDEVADADGMDEWERCLPVLRACRDPEADAAYGGLGAEDGVDGGEEYG